LNDQSRVVNAITGEEIPTNFGRGGMKKLFEQIDSGGALSCHTKHIERGDLARVAGLVHPVHSLNKEEQCSSE
jgi:hypothetical protein